ncbi:hypothetical protein PCG10_008053 [Penicillium crustosum]|uniref:beta-glucosidase n=2 Tax=Penicillium crustosum TaxID=36656 RepID=A0A9P5GUB9_PENCR|nr:hypothetical protein PCG10_008053 [Penicillium crustosum]
MFDQAVEVTRSSDVADVMVGHNKDSDGEGDDRTSLNAPGRTNNLVSAICAANPNTAIVVQSASAVSMPWIEQAHAIVLGWYQGQENGNALADVLLEAAQDRSIIGKDVLIGYTSFEEREVGPLWPLGFGLSYTSFSLSGVRFHGQMSTFTDSMIAMHACLSIDGEHDGHEVVQVYISPSSQIRAKGLDSYPKTLVGFRKTWMPAGKRVNFKSLFAVRN